MELTAEDVKYTFDTFRDPEFGARNIAFYDPIEEIIVHDPYTVEFKLAYPSAPIIYYLYAGIVPKHIAEEKGDEYFETNPVAAGPYVFEEWVANDRIVLKAFDDFFEGRPRIDEIVFRPIPETVTRVVELETGGVDAIDDLPPEDVERLKGVSGIEVTIRPGTGFEYYIFDHLTDPWSDKRIRQAFAHGLDRDAIIDHVFFGLREVAHTPILSTSWGHNPDVPKFEYNPDRVMELLAEAGYADGFSTTIGLSESPTRREIVEITQYQMEDYGIDIEILEMEWGAFSAAAVGEDFDGCIRGWSGQTDPDRGLYRQFHSSNWPPAGANRQRSSNARVDELLDLARTTSDQEVRQQYYFEVQEIIAEEQNYTTLNYSITLSAHSTDLKGYSGRDGHWYFRELKDAYLDR